MKLIEKKATTSKIIQVFVLDSSVFDGSGLTGLVHNSAGLTAYYIREGAASSSSISLVTATVGTYTSGGFIEVDATNMPGVYEFHLPNACLSAGAEQVVIFLKGASNMAPSPIEIQLRDNTEKDIYDAMALASTALSNITWTDVKAGYIDGAILSRAPVNEYDTEIAYIPTNLGDVPTAAELNSAHGSGVWTPADVSLLALETTSQLIKAKTDTIDWTNITSLTDEIGGKWEITGNQMIFYKADNTTEIMRFNLFNSSGNPAMIDVYKRERV